MNVPQSQLVDITTTGRRSGRASRIEVGMLSLDGRLYISGLPGPRSWFANVRADPRMTLHLKARETADLPARARVITDADERRSLLTRITRHWRREADLERFLASSPLIEVILDRDGSGPPPSPGG